MGVPWLLMDCTWSASYPSVHDLMGPLQPLIFHIEIHVQFSKREDPGHSSDFGIAPNREQVKSLRMDGP